MSAPVDVLAVMDETVEVLLDERMATTALGLEEARAAVAELIDIGSRINWYSHADVFAAFHAALARVKGTP